MADTFVFNNCITWAHYRIKGGRRILLLPTVGYGALIVGLIIASLRLNPRETESILNGWMIGLLAMQCGALLLYGCSTVRNAVRKDMTSGMIHSHRLMPISGTEAIAGYIMGSVPQPLAIFATNLLIGILVSGPARLSPLDWIVGNGLLLLFAACIWVVVVCISFLAPKSAGALMFLVILLAVPGGMVLLALPALTVLCTPVIGPTVYGVMSTGVGDLTIYYMPIMCQLCVTIVFFIVAVRKFRRDDVLAAGPLFGLLIVGVFLAVSAYGITHWSRVAPGLLVRGMGDMMPIQVLSSMIVAALLGLIPISAAAWLNEQYRRRRAIADPALGRRPPETILVVVAAAAMVALLPVFSMRSPSYRDVVLTFVSFAAGLTPIGALMQLRYRSKSSANILAVLWIALTWVGPWLVAFGMMTLSGAVAANEVSTAWNQASTVACLSPVATAIALWTKESMPYMPGLVGQVILAMAIIVLFYTRPAPHEVFFPVNGSPAS